MKFFIILCHHIPKKDGGDGLLKYSTTVWHSGGTGTVGVTTGITTVDGIDDGTCGDGTIQNPVVIVTCGTLDGTDELGTKTGE